MNLILAPKETEVRLNWYDAKRYCERLTTHAHTDWRLPTIYELGYLAQEYPLEFSQDEYWSSSERWKGSPGAYFIHRSVDGPLLSCWKEKQLLVKAVRKIECK